MRTYICSKKIKRQRPSSLGFFSCNWMICSQLTNTDSRRRPGGENMWHLLSTKYSADYFFNKMIPKCHLIMVSFNLICVWHIWIGTKEIKNLNSVKNMSIILRSQIKTRTLYYHKLWKRDTWYVYGSISEGNVEYRFLRWLIMIS